MLRQLFAQLLTVRPQLSRNRHAAAAVLFRPTPNFNSASANAGIFVKDVDDLELTSFTHLKVVEVVSRGNFNRAGTFFRISVLVRHDGDGTINNRQHDVLADQIRIALVLRMNGNRRIA